MTTPRPDGYDPIDQALTDAFASVRAGGRPSLSDVHRRARRHQRRRTTAMVGALAVMGAGGVAALATRGTPAATDVPAGDDGQQNSATTTTQYFEWCIESDVTTTIPVGTYVLQDGDTPLSVAAKFGVSLESLAAANSGDPAYEAFVEGKEIFIPAGGQPVRCPQPSGSYRCIGEGTLGGDGYIYYDYCELVLPETGPTTTIMWDPSMTTTTGPTGTYVVESTTPGLPVATSTTNVVDDPNPTSTTTTLP